MGGISVLQRRKLKDKLWLNKIKIVAISLAIILLSSFLFSFIITLVHAAETPTGKCENNFPDLLSDIPWNAMFPLRIGGKVVLNMGDMPDNVNTENPDDYNPSSYVCTCNKNGISHAGVWVSFWEPARVVEVITKPHCFSFLFGLDMGDALSDYGAYGTRSSSAQSPGNKAFYNVHVYSFPLLSIMNIILDMDFCADWFSDIDIVYFTEVDPLWNDDELSIWLNPEAAVFANPIAQALCSVDCVASTAGIPINAMFWCAGCWGSMYPYTGNTGLTASPVRTTSLLMARVLAKLTRQPVPPAMELDTSGAGAKCGDISDMIIPVIKKSQYRISMLKPIPETDKGHTLGSSTFLWGEHRNIPGTGENHIYLIWRKRNCCLKFL